MICFYVFLLHVVVYAAAIDRENILVSGWDETRCNITQKTKDTFVSSGTYFHPSYETHENGKVVLLSHGRVQAFDVDTQVSEVLYESKNLRFRGMYSKESSSVYLITPNVAEESRFLELDDQYHVINNVKAKGTWDGHDMVRYGTIVYVVSTGNGCLQVYDADTFEFKRSHKVASKKEHINTIALSSSVVYVMFHHKNVNMSEIKVFDKFSFELVETYADVGWSAHGLSLWNDTIVSLDSLGGSLVLVGDEVRPVWTCEKCFLKGLVVVGNQACFGRSPPQRRMKRLSVNSSVVCVDLNTGDTVSETKMNTNGLLNHIIHSDYLSIHKYDLMPVSSKRNMTFKYKPLGPIDIYDTREFFLDHWDEIWGPFEFRSIFGDVFTNVGHCWILFSFKKNKALFKNMFGSMYAVDTSIEMPFAWKFLKPVVVPMLDSLFGRLGVARWEERILRLQFNLIPEGGYVGNHIDIHYYSDHAHRIHIPIFSSKCIVFDQHWNDTWHEVPFKEGEAFEINNKILHRVLQHGPYNRVTLIVDYLDKKCSSFAQLDQSLTSGNISETLNLDVWRGDARVHEEL